MPKQIYIKKEELLEKLGEKLKLHKIVYQESLKAFKKNYVNHLKMLIKKANKNKFVTYMDLIVPKNHEEDYHTAIKMIKMSCRDEIELTDREFKQYILNKWDWMETFKMAYIRNCSSTSSSSSGSSSLSKSASAYFEK